MVGAFEKTSGKEHEECTVEVYAAQNIQTPEKEIGKFQIPHIGMIFESHLAARNYYEDYGRQEGFWIRTRSSCKARSHLNEFTSVILVCSHQGQYVDKIGDENIMEEGNSENQVKRKRRNCSTVKGGCNAFMRIKHNKWSNKWEISGFSDDHNHKVVTPTRRMKMKCNRHMPKAARDLTEAFHRENLQIGKVSSILGGEVIGFSPRDCYNHLKNVRHRELEGGDAQSVLTYFRKKQGENPQFFYAIQCDENGRATNFFWVDARSRMSYRYFGDVVTFDTTYRTNKYDMPFAPFTGVNHHFQSIQFGCALLQDETETTFTWLFESWLEAMDGRHPISIITDQDLAMKGAIAQVFPKTRHRLCYWHIKKKFGEKLSPNLYHKKSKFKIELKKCLWSARIDKFESKWKELMTEYNLEKDEWLRQLYDIRASWVPTYNFNTFYAGMNTTGRSEGVNAFFDAFVTPKTNLREFVVKYEQALKKILTKENDEDYVSEHTYRIVKSNEYLLKHAATIYTRNVFNKFKDEWKLVNYFKVEEKECVDGYQTYLLKSKDVDEFDEFVVKINMQSYEGSCECQKFEFLGIPCRHILKLFVRLDIDTIPDHFILPRWKQEANKFRIMDSIGLVNNEGDKQVEALRFNHLCQESTKLACYASTSNKAYTMCIQSLKELSKKLESINEKSISNEEVPISPINISEHEDSRYNHSASQPLLLDPNISLTKGRKKDVKGSESHKGSGRIKSGMEKALAKKKRICKLCNKSAGHDKRNCPLNNNRKDIQSTTHETDSDENETE